MGNISVGLIVTFNAYVLLLAQPLTLQRVS